MSSWSFHFCSALLAADTDSDADRFVAVFVLGGVCASLSLPLSFAPRPSPVKNCDAEAAVGEGSLDVYTM